MSALPVPGSTVTFVHPEPAETPFARGVVISGLLRDPYSGRAWLLVRTAGDGLLPVPLDSLVDIDEAPVESPGPATRRPAA